MPGGMQNLMKQAQRMQRQMEEKQKEMEEAEFTGTAGGGAVTAVLDGKKILKKVTIEPAAVDPEDVETLEEMIIMAVNDAGAKVDEMSESIYGAMGNGLNLGGFGL